MTRASERFWSLLSRQENRGAQTITDKTTRAPSRVELELL